MIASSNQHVKSFGYRPTQGHNAAGALVAITTEATRKSLTSAALFVGVPGPNSPRGSNRRNGFAGRASGSHTGTIRHQPSPCGHGTYSWLCPHQFGITCVWHGSHPSRRRSSPWSCRIGSSRPRCQHRRVGRRCPRESSQTGGVTGSPPSRAADATPTAVPDAGPPRAPDARRELPPPAALAPGPLAHRVGTTTPVPPGPALG